MVSGGSGIGTDPLFFSYTGHQHRYMTTIPQLFEGKRQPLASTRDFEQLLLEVSSLFINLPVESIDTVIEQTQRKICESLEIDLSVLWQWSDKDANLMTITHLYSIPGGPEPAADIDGSRAFPWVYAKMLAGETLAFSTKDLPDEAKVDKSFRSNFDVISSVCIPLQVGGGPTVGILTFDTLKRERMWKDEEVQRLTLVADIFANTLVRKQSVQKLVESEERLSLAAESAEAGLWELDCISAVFWATDQARRIFGYYAKETISMDRFEQSIYPEDLEKVRRAIAISFDSNDKLDIEYRIHTVENACKWICSRGRPYFDDEGSPASIRGVSIDISNRKMLEEQLNFHVREIEELKQQIEQENYYLREDLKKEQGFEHIVGQSRTFRAAFTSAQRVAPTSATVLLTGETGTGKGVVAHAIHQMSERRQNPFVTVNCAALPEELIESELFGREKGAFTGAHASQAGRFEVANKGTVFLDEIGEMPLAMQAKLLRILQEGTFERLGSPRTVAVDVRVIAATGRNLADDVKSGRFRQDLFYRLNVFPIALPPLRDRLEDIPLLAQHFIEKYCRKIGKKVGRIAKRSLELMVEYRWPGNIRELEHLVERSLIMSSGNTLVIHDNLLPVNSSLESNETIKDLAANERDHIQRVLELTQWKIEGAGGAATVLNIHPSTLRFRLKKFGLKRPS